MEIINNIIETIKLLKEGQLLCRGKDDLFFYRKNKIYEYQNGNRFCFSLSQFQELFINDSFYITKQKTFEIDTLKDDDYYRNYHK